MPIVEVVRQKKVCPALSTAFDCQKIPYILDPAAFAKKVKTATMPLVFFGAAS